MEELYARLAELHQEGVAELKRVNAIARESTDPALLALCHGRAVAMLTAGRWDEPPGLGDRACAFLDFTEQFVTSVSHIADADVERLLEHASAEEVYCFIGALYVLEMTTRVELVAREVLA
jgi:alkylhydroperoxidase family enzyme